MTVLDDIMRIQPNDMAAPGGHYSHATVAAGLVFVSGQLPITPDGTRLTDAPFGQQVTQVLTNIERVLTASGSSIGKLLQVRVYVTDIARWPEFNEIYARWAGSATPARAVVPVPELHFGLSIEVEAIALA